MIQDSDILLCKSTGFIPALIQWETGSVYSHVAVIASAKLGLIVEAVPEGGVRAIWIENYKTPHDLYRVKDRASFNHSEVVAYLIRTLARKYDFQSTIQLGWKFFLRRLGLVRLAALKIAKQKEAADSLQKDQDYFCSELCYRAFMAGGLDIVPQIGDAETTTPGDIARSPLMMKVSSVTLSGLPLHCK